MLPRTLAWTWFGVAAAFAQTYTIKTVAAGPAASLNTPCPAGDNGLALKACLDGVNAIAADSAGDFYFVQDNSTIRYVSASTGIITTPIGPDAGLYSPMGLAMDSNANLYIADTNNQRILEYSGGAIRTIAAGLTEPQGITVDSGGNVFFTDANRIRRIDAATHALTTVAGTGVLGYTGDGGPAVNAELNGAVSVAVDSLGDIYIAEYTRIRKVAFDTGIISTIAGNGDAADSGDLGPASQAQLYSPNDIVVDSTGNLYIEDLGYSVIRKVDAASGIISTIAGVPLGPGFYGDGGPAQLAGLDYPHGLALDGQGNIFIADLGNDRVRELSPNGPTTPYVAPNGIVSVDGDFTQVESGSWATIYGVNLANTFATWNGDFPKNLGGVTVTIDSRPAYLWYVSPTQINFQVPDDSTLGTVSVAVTNSLGTGNSTVRLATVAPAFNLFSSGYVAAVIPTPDGSGAYGNGTYDLAGPPGYLPFTTRNVKQGETILLYGTGWGPTTPTVDAGQAFSGSAPTTNP